MEGVTEVSRPTGTRHKLVWTWNGTSDLTKSTFRTDTHQLTLFFSIWKNKMIQLLEQYSATSSECTRRNISYELTHSKRHTNEQPKLENDTLTQKMWSYDACTNGHGHPPEWITYCNRKQFKNTDFCAKFDQACDATICLPPKPNAQNTFCDGIITTNWKTRLCPEYYYNVSNVNRGFLIRYPDTAGLTNAFQADKQWEICWKTSTDYCQQDVDGTGEQSSRDCFRHPTFRYFETQYEITCEITPKFPAFEPTKTDLVIQEQYHDANQVNTHFFLRFQEWNQNNQFPIKSAKRLILLEPRPIDQRHHYLDGEPHMNPSYGYYASYPSMMKDDSSCHQRVASKPECSALVTGIEGKLGFFDYVIFDPAHNSPNYPGLPLQLLGTRGARGTIPEHPYGRSKRQLTAAVVLFSLAASAISATISGVATGELLQKEMDQKIKDLENQVNEHFTRDEANLRTLAERINALDTTNYAQDQAIVSTLTNLIKTQALQEQTDTFLQTEISDNQRLLLQNVDLFMKSNFQERTLSLAELELDKLIIAWSSNLTGKNLFNKTSLYLTRISQGSMYLQTYATLASTHRSNFDNSISHDNETFDSLHQAIEDSIKNTNQTLVTLKHATSNKPILINISDPEWNPKPINVDLNSTFLTSQDFADAFLDGVHTIPHAATEAVSDVVDDVADVVGNGTSHLIASTVGPISGIIVLAIVIVLLKKHGVHINRKRRQRQSRETKENELQPTTRKLLNLLNSKGESKPRV